MTTKLTLTIKADVIRSAELYAQKSGRSVSELVETFLQTLATEDQHKESTPPLVKRLLGAVALPNDFNYKDELQEELQKKHRG